MGWSYWYFCPHNNPFVAYYNKGKSALCGYGVSDVVYGTKKPRFENEALPLDM